MPPFWLFMLDYCAIMVCTFLFFMMACYRQGSISLDDLRSSILAATVWPFILLLCLVGFWMADGSKVIWRRK